MTSYYCLHLFLNKVFDTEMRCSIKGCNNSATKNNRNISFFSFPSDEKRRKAWIAAVKLENVNFKKDKICSIHFKESDYKPVSTKFLLGVPNSLRRLNNTAVPMTFSPPTATKVTISNNGNVKKIITKKKQHSSATERHDQSPPAYPSKDVNDNTAIIEPYEQRSVTKDNFHETVSDELNENCIDNQMESSSDDVSMFDEYKILMKNYLEVKKSLKEAKQANQTFVMYQNKFELALLERDNQIKKNEDSIKKYEDSIKNYENFIKKSEKTNQELKRLYQNVIRQLENEYTAKIKELRIQNTSMQKQLSEVKKLLAAKDKKCEELEETMKQIFVQD